MGINLDDLKEKYSAKVVQRNAQNMSATVGSPTKRMGGT